MKKYVAYYRVSTAQQGASGLGLSAQKDTVKIFVGSAGCILAEFTEIESGKNATRAELQKAIAQAKLHNAKLLVAKLDRLSRDVKFIFTLRDAGVDFIACDLPDCNTLTLGIFASFAQFERERISERTKAGLAQAKLRGTILGNPKSRKDASGKGWFDEEVRLLGIQVRKTNARTNHANQVATELVVLYREQGLSYAAIASKLNMNHKTRHGAEFKSMTVKRLFDRAKMAD